MKKFTQKNHGNHVSLIKIIMLLFCFLPFASFAQFSGNGTQAEPFQISTAAELAQLATFVNAGDVNYNAKYYILTNNIDLSDYQSGNGWTPIGMSSAGNSFKGDFNGANYKVTGLAIKDIAQPVGLFGVVSGKVRNLGIENFEIETTNSQAGGVVGFLYQGEVTNCYVKNGNVISEVATYASSVGGVVGVAYSGKISNCYASASVSGFSFSLSAQVGGVVGWITENSKIANCYSTGTVYGYANKETANGGGVVGRVNNSEVTRCYSTSTVFVGSSEGIVCIGGIAGGVWENSKISHCAALNPGLISPASDVTVNMGRIVGYVGTSPTSDLLFNIAFNKMIDNVYYCSSSWMNDGYTKKDGAGYATAQIGDGSLNSCFKSEDGWTLENGKLPGFGSAVTMPIYLQNVSGLVSEPYLIHNAEVLKSLADYVNAGFGGCGTWGRYFKMTNDIDLSAYSNGKGWTPIGYYYYDEISFSGTFDGNNKVITGMKINNNDLKTVGLFGSLSGAIIKNLSIENFQISCSNMWYAGGLVGTMIGSTLSNCKLTGTVTSINNTNDAFIGGIVGDAFYMNNTITDCYFKGEVLGSSLGSASIYAGGIIGSFMFGTKKRGGVDDPYTKILNCFSTANVESTSPNSWAAAGGIIGFGDNIIIFNCYSTGNVTSTSNEKETASGGVAGNIRYAEISNCYATGEISSFSNSQAYAGGIAGNIQVSTVKHCAALNPSIFSSDINSSAPIRRVVGVIVGDCNLLNNIAFNEMKNPKNDTLWNDKGLLNRDGADITKVAVNADGTLGARFTGAPWTTAKGKLPGLFGTTVEMPPHLRLGNSITSTTLSNQIEVWPNPTTGELRIENGELRTAAPVGASSAKLINNVEIYDVYGRKQLSIINCQLSIDKIDISHLQPGIYFVRVVFEGGSSVKKLVKL